MKSKFHYHIRCLLLRRDDSCVLIDEETWAYSEKQALFLIAKRYNTYSSNFRDVSIEVIPNKKPRYIQGELF